MPAVKAPAPPWCPRVPGVLGLGVPVPVAACGDPVVARPGQGLVVVRREYVRSGRSRSPPRLCEQRLLSDLKDHRSSLSGLAAGNIGELQAIVQEQDDLIAAIEAQIDRLRKLLLLREQFIALITEISTFILTYTGVVRDIESSGQPSDEKIKRYHDVSIRGTCTCGTEEHGG